jgi:phosphoribosylformimino-5-aminoimidazole carboxamide ribotide isomerase
LHIIPVLDLMDGQVVQGFRGERENYRPIQSVLTSATDPLHVAAALQAETKCRAFYIADLNAIQKQGDHHAIIRKLAGQLDADLWVDAGAKQSRGAQKVLETGASQVIIGSETLDHLAALHHIQELVRPERLLFSLDIAGGKVLSDTPDLTGQRPLAALRTLVAAGLSRFIILTLDRVGTGTGPDYRLLQGARQAFPHLFVVAGGGVRTPDDLQQLATTGVNGVLIASALHRGWITRQDLAPFSPAIQ